MAKMETTQLLMNPADSASGIDLVIENLDEFAVVESFVPGVTGLTAADYVIRKSAPVAIS
jgi:hypothetical protein